MNHPIHKPAARAAYFGSLAILALLVTSLAGCTLFGGPTAEQQQDREGSITFSSDEGEGSINFGEDGVSFTGQDGESTASFGQTLPSNWPTDLPTPGTATLNYSGSTQEPDGSTTFSAIYTSRESVDTVLAELSAAYTAAGWTVEGEYNASFSGVVSAGFTATKGNNSASIVLGADTNEPGEISVTIGAEYR